MTTIASRRLVFTMLVATAAVACSGSEGTPIDGGTLGGSGGGVAQVGGQANGGSLGAGGASVGTGGISTDPSLGGAPAGSATASTGGSNASTGGLTGKGGSTSAGGAGTGGSTSTGGASKGGSTSTGGAGKGGSTSTGGASKGGSTSTGGAGTGGSTSTGGASQGGSTSTGGAGTGGATGTCTPDWGTVPSDVGAWVNESWNDQLGANTKNRKAWLLDSVMLGQGQLNLCVRWGATTAPTAAVKTGMAAAVQKWFNDWFSQLKDYGCFPYPTVTAKVTGWAVKPGNTGWVSDLGSDVKIYTETDAEGEPKCADSCSFFENWSHKFPNCPGGEAFHQDYWLWLDDSIGGGAAAVGGDWGLRMPVSNFVSSMNKSNLVIEHEMGHGFGFQDYYEWTGSRPTGGSLMIVGSTSSQSPTTADTWLLRRTWKEMKALRGW